MDEPTRRLIQAHTDAMRELTIAIARQTHSIGELCNTVALLVEQGMGPDDQPDTAQGVVLMSGKGN